MLLFLGDIAFSWPTLLVTALWLVGSFLFWRWLLGWVSTSKRGQTIVAGAIALLMLPTLYFVFYLALSLIAFNFFN